MSDADDVLARHAELTRRFFLGCGAVWAAGSAPPARAGEPLPPDLAPVLDKIEPYFTPPAEFRDVSRGNPIPHTLPDP
jgi:hypothetical protein